MEFTNEIIEEMQEKKQYNSVYSKYYYKLSMEQGNNQTIKNKSENINDCLNLWLWDVYHQNKIMDLKTVNRCKDNRFCPNCKKFSLASAIHNFSPKFKELLDEGYNPYLLTLTVPNVKGAELRETIDKLNKGFRKLFQLMSLPVGKGQHGFSSRLMEWGGALKVLELTHNKKANTYHPHFHVIVFSKNYNKEFLEKNIPGAYSKKRKQYDKYSEMDIQVMKLWKLCYEGERVNKKNYFSSSNEWYDLYLCDFKEMDVNGIYEVMKYTFKDTDITSYNVFKTIYISLAGKRIRQGYGILYNLKCEDEAEGEKQDLGQFIEKEESPQELLTHELKELITVYSEYKKISRFKAYTELNNIS